MAAHLFAEEINTESDLVGENLATKGDELYFQDLPIYNKLISLQQRWGKKPPPTKTRKRNTLRNEFAGRRKGRWWKMLKIGSNQQCEQLDGERSKGDEHMERRPKE